MSKKYQKIDDAARAMAVPDVVSVSLAEIAADVKEGLLALAVGAGLQVMAALFAEDVTALCGPKGKHDKDRLAYRHGVEAGSVTLGGRRLPVVRPRVRAADGSSELSLPTYEVFSSTQTLSAMAMQRMLSGLSARRYGIGLEPVGAAVQRNATGTSKSAISRRFVTMTETALGDLLGADLSDLDLVALMVDGVYFAEHLCVVVLGVGIDGTKCPLALADGSTENASLVRDLLVSLRERGLDVTKPILAVLDGSKALRRAVCDVFDHPVIARCQLHKLRNVTDKLPQHMRPAVAAKMRKAYHADSALAAQGQLEALARELDKTHPNAAGSLREGLEETLTVLRLDLPPTLLRTLRSTNAIESMISISREHAKNVTRWRDGKMALRWCAAGMVEASKQFRRVNGHLHLPTLRAALEREVAENVTATSHNEEVNAA